MTSDPNQPFPPSSPAPDARPSRPGPATDTVPDDLRAEMDAAMAAAMVPEPQTTNHQGGGRGHGHHPGHAAPDRHAPAQIRGPRVVQAGREIRPGVVVSVGPTD